ncbi:SixA phosphatase family protein [Cellulomonas cellasea]|uniref:Phosphohistidine phosphatase n=2 Tax=Cellulomonas cellasea TaxID=43670 RepID=A0A0A0BA52_9CELL|nr:histidine phosphatase family protein [Cellulomonas cellasea]KGM03043.1 phosphohistidine phosphatase [Cellulomonas cellasea DSM 20118]GEA90207.1 phosphoglycerate mutase [Cellulomonas cellasea]
MAGTSPVARRLVLLRHAKAEPGGVLDDHVRTLALEGRRQAALVGASLREAGLVPDVVLCSSSVRTRQTWDVARNALGADAGHVEVSDELYTAGARELLELVRSVDPEARTVLLVGHEPTVSQAAALLAGPGSDETAQLRVRTGVPTASYSVLETDVAWSALEPDGARLLRLVTAD